MQLPEHYRKVFRTYLRFAISWMVLALLIGIMFQESAKKTPFSAALTPGPHLETIINLALVHGHAFLIGVLIPLSVTWILYLGLAMGYAPVTEKTLRIGTRLYLPASAIAIILILYKGYHVQLGVREQISTGTPLDFMAINQSYFFGIHALRAIAYGLTHTAMAVGLSMIVISFWRNMKPNEG